VWNAPLKAWPAFMIIEPSWFASEPSVVSTWVNVRCKTWDSGIVVRMAGMQNAMDIFDMMDAHSLQYRAVDNKTNDMNYIKASGEVVTSMGPPDRFEFGVATHLLAFVDATFAPSAAR
jgi:hypothetical protein